jgi:hypothetical protein
MSLLWNWFWTPREIQKDEQEVMLDQQKKLMAEMQRYLNVNGVALQAERRYDYEEAQKELCDLIDAAYKIFGRLSKNEDGLYEFHTKMERVQISKALEQYFDAVVRHKDFVRDNEVLWLAVADKILEYASTICVFDWHYWQLYRRNLTEDMKERGMVPL